MQKSWTYETAWLSGFRYDSFFIFGVLGLALFSGAIVLYDPALFVPVLFLDLWFLGYHHVIATFTKLGGTKEDREENKFLIYYLPFIVVAVVGGLAFGIGIWIISTIYFFWQWYHYTRQSYGISSFYHRKSSNAPSENKLLVQSVIWAIPVWGILHRCSQGWDEFLFHPIWLPAVPEYVATTAGFLAMSLVFYWAILRLMDFKNGRLSLGSTYFMISHFIAFYVGYILMDDIVVGWLVANVWHNAQYILFVWLYNTKRFKNYDNDPEGISYLGWMSQTQPIRIFMYFLTCLVITTLIYSSMQKGLEFIAQGDKNFMLLLYITCFQALNFHHYIVDSLIWKARKKQTQTVMNLKQK